MSFAMKKHLTVFLLLVLYSLVCVCDKNVNNDGLSLIKEMRGTEEKMLMISSRIEENIRKKRKIVEKSSLWPQAIIPFDFQDPLPDISKVLEGIEEWETYTCLRFSRVNDSKSAHIIFQKLIGCRSSVGRKEQSGQVVSIGETCNKVGIVIHEIGHALGFYHEIRRLDRDDFVVINYENILEEEQFNFDKMKSVNKSIPYDLSSIMHYSPLEWSKNGKTTVATVDPMLQGIVGAWKTNEALGLSHRDKLMANLVYGCIDKWLLDCELESDPCEGEGYLGASCKCVCPRGRTGSFCETEIGSYYDDLKSSCSETIMHEKEINSPGYPLRYPNDSWCTYEIDGGECFLPSVTFLDFELGPRDVLDHCSFDYLEIRHENPYHGLVKCGKELSLGETFKGLKKKMILFFKSELGGSKGFKARVTFDADENCCRTFKIGSSVHVLSPKILNQETHSFLCPLHFNPKHPERLKISSVVYNEDGNERNESALPFPCEIDFCFSDNRCRSLCRKKGNEFELEIILPNSGTIHSFKSSTKIEESVRLVFTPEPSTCHKVLELNELNTTLKINEGPLGDRSLQCEWKIMAPKLSHVKLRMEKMKEMPFSRNSYLIINEIGDLSYSPRVSRKYTTENEVPTSAVSIKESLSIVVDGNFATELSLSVEIYNCTDEYEECDYWSSKGECQNNSEWMNTFCKQSCLMCEYSFVCEDKELECNYWARKEECSANENWMKLYCAKSCGHCDSCTNQNRNCDLWRDLGHCKSNAEYMKVFCRKSCNFCKENLRETAKMDNSLNVTSGEEKAFEFVNETKAENSSEKNFPISRGNFATNLEIDSKPRDLLLQKKLPMRSSTRKSNSVKFPKKRRNKLMMVPRKGNLTLFPVKNLVRNETANPFLFRNLNKRIGQLNQKRFRKLNCSGKFFIRHKKNKIKIMNFRHKKFTVNCFMGKNRFGKRISRRRKKNFNRSEKRKRNNFRFITTRNNNSIKFLNN